MKKIFKAVFLPNLYKKESRLLIGESKNSVKDWHEAFIDKFENKDFNPQQIEKIYNLIENLNKDDNKEGNMSLDEDDILLEEAKELRPKIALLKDIWIKKQYCGYGIYTQYDGYIYEGMFKNNYINGFGMFITPDGKIKIGQYNNFIPKGKGEIYKKIEGQLKFLLYRRKINIDCFIGEDNIKKKQF